MKGEIWFMGNFLVWLKWLVALVGGLITSLLGGWDLALQVLVLFVVLDYITGLVAAYGEQNLNSRVGFRGIAKKILLFVPVAVAYWLDTLLGQEILRSLAIFFYIANEGLSMMENLGRAGVPFPEQIQIALEQLKGDGEHG
ncbi:MAG TPA: phage holin family protein [Candidatus Saccharicenans sp.]|nr:phage holin family protein [Candidatus Saccharicenans sp.]